MEHDSVVIIAVASQCQGPDVDSELRWLCPVFILFYSRALKKKSGWMHEYIT